jgi:hypothetical protein
MKIITSSQDTQCWRWVVLVCLCTLVAACIGTEPPQSTEDERLDGKWTLELRRRGSVPRVVGELVLESPSDSASTCADDDERVCQTRVVGTHSLNVEKLLGRTISESAEGAITTDNGLILFLGGCCHRGEISLSGTIAGPVVRGEWISAVGHGNVTRGDFRLVRVADP